MALKAVDRRWMIADLKRDGDSLAEADALAREREVTETRMADTRGDGPLLDRGNISL